MVNEWTSDDLPDPVILAGLIEGMKGATFTQSAVIVDAVVEHLNAHHPKPEPDRLERQAATIGELQGCFLRVEADAARWRRAHEIVEGERDQARRERDMWKEKCLDTHEALHQARTERDEAEQRYRDTAKALTEWHGRWVEMERERDEWKARAEAAEARTAPAVTRADVAEALARCLDPEMWNVTFPSVVNEVCDLFGIEAEQGVDPVEAKARELAKAGGVDFDEQEPEGVDMLLGMARHVLGQEAGDGR